MLSDHPVYAYVPAIDVERAREFYEQKVGLAPGIKTGPGYTFQFAEGTAFFLYPTPNAGGNRASCAFWMVPDVRAVVEDLKSRGIVFEEYDMPHMVPDNSVYTGGGASTAWFMDTEGNTMAVVQSVEG